MKNITPRRQSGKPSLAKALFFVVGFLYAAREVRVIWIELARSLRRLRRH